MSAACVSCVPWEKFNRKTSTPAATNSRMIPSLADAGPSVAMIFVLRMNPIVAGSGDDSSTLDPWTNYRHGSSAHYRTWIGGSCLPCVRCSKPSHARPLCSARPTGIWKLPTGPSRPRHMSAEPRTLAETGRLLRSRELTAEAVTEGCLGRIAEANRSINAYITVLTDEALRQAKEADQEIAAGNYRGPLHGVPISLKDIIDLRDAPTTAASRVRDGHVARRDATVVSRLRQAGAIFIRK